MAITREQAQAAEKYIDDLVNEEPRLKHAIRAIGIMREDQTHYVLIQLDNPFALGSIPIEYEGVRISCKLPEGYSR